MSMCACEHTYTRICINPNHAADRGMSAEQNGVYKRFSLHIRFPAEPSATRMCDMSGSTAELIGSNVTIRYACCAYIHLRH